LNSAGFRIENLLSYLSLSLAYLFLFTVSFFIYKEFREAPKKLTLKIYDKERKLKVKLEKKKVFLGRAPDVDIKFQDIHVSSHHAQIFFEDNKWYIEDLGSKNGTKINGKKINRPHPLTIGDKIEIGQSIIFLEEEV
jgi:hypothetical protein